MNLTCDIVCDLTPLYKDGLASSDSKAAVEHHLKKCPSCRLFYKKLYETHKTKTSKTQPTKMGAYSALATMLSRRKRKEHIIFNSTLYGVVGISIALTVAGLVKAYRK